MPNTTSVSSSWFRNVSGRLAAGVCASIAAHFGWNPVLVRVAFIASLMISGGLACWVYLAFWAVTPFDIAGTSLAQRVLASVGRLFDTTVRTARAPAVSHDEGASNISSVE